MAKPVRTTLLSVAGLLLLGLMVGHWTGAKHPGPIPYIGRGAGAGAVLFVVTGLAAAARLTPGPLKPVWPIFALPAGAVLGPLGLTVLGFAAIPLQVSLWLVLAAGIAAWLRWGRGKAPRVNWLALLPWAVAGLLVFLLATIPDWRLNETTIFGDNPDSHQVVGTAVLFQHAPPWATRAGLPINEVPSAWRFRYPILYALAGTSNLAHFDPIFVFPAMSGLLVMLAALGFGALAVMCLRLPLAAGPWVAMITPLNALTLHVTWHPYYNQLWGLALLPWTVAVGWWAVRERSRGAGFAFLGGLVALGLAYPLSILYPLVLVAALAWAHRLPRPRVPRPRGAAQWAMAVGIVALLAVPAYGAASRSVEGLRELFDLHGSIWGGDVFVFLPYSTFVGTNAGVIGMLAVVLVAAVAVARLLPRREAIAVGVLFGVCALFDVRLRISDRGQYMELKHLGYVGALVLAVAAAGVVALAVSRSRIRIAAALALFALWFVPAIGRIRNEVGHTHEQVTADMLRLRDWAKKIPAGASIRIDVPPSGVQLWVQYMLAGHPLGAVNPVRNTTYAHAPFSLSGDYSLAPRFVPNPNPKIRVPWPAPMYRTGPPAFQSFSFLLRPLSVPQYGPFLDNSSRLMVQP